MAKLTPQQQSADRAFWSLIDLIRKLPFKRGKMRFFQQLLAHKASESIDQHFECNVGVPLRWSSRGLPDLLTRHMLLTGSYQNEVIRALLGFLRANDVM